MNTAYLHAEKKFKRANLLAATTGVLLTVITMLFFGGASAQEYYAAEDGRGIQSATAARGLQSEESTATGLIDAARLSPGPLVAQTLFLLVVFLLVTRSGHERAHALALGQRLIKDERERIAQELHDSLLQDIIAARMVGRELTDELTSDQRQERTRAIMSLLESATAAARASVTSLSRFDEVPSLFGALHEFADRCRLKCGPHVSVQQRGTPWTIPAYQRYFVFRLAREAIANACKHANASSVYVELHWRVWRLDVLVRDDGDGVANINAVVPGFGLTAMQRMSKAGNVRVVFLDGDSTGFGVRLSVRRRRI